MPAAAPVALGAAAGALASSAAVSIGIGLGFTGLAFVGGTFASHLAFSFATTLVLGGVSAALQKKPKTGGFGGDARDRTLNVRQPITTRSKIYGQVRVGGPPVFMASTENNLYLHLVIPLAGHKVARIGAVYFNDEALSLDESGHVVAGPYAGRALVHKHLGAADQEADSELRSALPDKWTAHHRLRGVAYLYVRLRWDQAVYGVSGVPQISAIVCGQEVYDPRTGLTGWSDNGALCIADYLRDETYGLGASEAEIRQAALIAAANACDEMVGRASSVYALSVDVGSQALTCEFNARLVTGTRVRVASSGTLPGGLASGTDYYWIMDTGRTGRFASSLSNARAGVALSVSDAGSGAHSLTVQAEPRYTCNGTIDSSRPPREILQAMLTAIAGVLVLTGGRWGIYPAVYRTPTLMLDESDLRAPIRVQARVSMREQFNAVKGVCVDPFSSWMPTDLPPVTNETYRQEDGGERRYKDSSLPFTISVSAGQRVNKIELERARQAITVTLPCKLTAFRCGVPDVILLSNAQLGWTEKPFEVRSWTFAIADDRTLGVDLQLRETAPGVYDWNSGEETAVDLAANTDLPNAFLVLPPGAPAVTEELYVTRDGAGVKTRAIVSWMASGDAFAVGYQLEYKPTAAAAWTVLPETPDTRMEVPDLEPGLYDWRVLARNRIGAESEYRVTLKREITGLLAAPAAITGLTISAISSIALLRWTQHPELDVRHGGKIVFRHSPLMSGASWPTSTSIGEAVPGTANSVALPLKQGTYLAKAIDSSGLPSDEAATVVTKAGIVVPFADVDEVVEHPSFGGSHDGTAAADDVLTLTGTGLFDDIPDFDAVPNLDAIGGIRSAGTYTFAGGLDLGSVQRVRLASHIEAATVSEDDLFDSRTTNIDDWEDFDGGSAGAGDARVWVRETDDDPTGSPTWSDWQLLDVAEFNARAFQFQCRLTTSDPAYNVIVTELSVRATEVA